jgi:hypothetical protein
MGKSITFYCVVLDEEASQMNDNIPCIKKLENPDDPCGQVTIPSTSINITGCKKEKIRDCEVTIIDVNPPATKSATVWMITCPDDSD